MRTSILKYDKDKPFVLMSEKKSKIMTKMYKISMKIIIFLIDKWDISIISNYEIMQQSGTKRMVLLQQNSLYDTEYAIPTGKTFLICSCVFSRRSKKDMNRRSLLKG